MKNQDKPSALNLSKVDLGRLPLALRGCVPLPRDPAPTDANRYDPARQLWIGADGVPAVAGASFGDRLAPSSFGETTMTKAPEGTDVPDAALVASTFGETQMTFSAEGADDPDALVGTGEGLGRV